jgi:hypothetical protein
MGISLAGPVFDILREKISSFQKVKGLKCIAFRFWSKDAEIS